MAREGGRLCGPGPCRGIRGLAIGLVFQCGRPAAVRDCAVALRPRIPRRLRELLIAAGPGEWRAALVKDGAAVELYIERGDTRPPGSIHLGRVVRRAPGLDSAFV